MADSSLETQIDCFLEQFKRSASKAMEERQNVCRSRSSYLENDSPEEPISTTCEEIEMQNTVTLEPLGVNDVTDLLQHQYAVISGGKSKDGCPIITFPDNNNFQMLSDQEYQKLMLYLTSVPSLQEADLGFHLIIDRRKDRWNSVKTVLLKISVYFPGLIHVVYVIRPTSFFHKTLSEVSNKLSKDEFKFRMVVLSSAEELHEYVNITQLTSDLGGTLPYNHDDWIQQRIELEKFSTVTHDVSNALDNFTKTIEETELPNNVDSTQQLLNRQTQCYSDLKDEILAAAKHGENLLCSIKQKTYSEYADNEIPHTDMVGNVFAVERLLVQLEETEKTFDEFWQQHSTNLRHCLELRRFEQDFRELQSNFDGHFKTVSEMTEIGETASRVDTLIKETVAFEKLCLVDIERAEEVISSGQHLITIKNSCPLECVQPKCAELKRMKDILIEKLTKRMEDLNKCRELMERMEKANKWCSVGIDVLASQKIEKCSTSTELAESYLQEIQDFIATAKEFTTNNPRDLKHIFQDSITAETKALVTQVIQRIDDVSLMCENRIACLNKILTKPLRPIHSVSSEPGVPRQPQGGAPQPNRAELRRAYTIPKMDSSINHDHSSQISNLSPETDEVNRIKTGHVLTELLETERLYVSELLSIITGYKLESQTEDMQRLLPANSQDKFNIIFGNLEEIYSFHSEVFLKDLENCITSTDLVALCFVQKRDKFFRLYSYYCQNISRSEQLRENALELHAYFQACQQKLGHKLPLAAYLLKPVQRITKYQLLLKDLLRYSDETKCCKQLQQALDCMLIVLKCLNDSMHQISITGFPIGLGDQGDLLLQGSFQVMVDNKTDLKIRLSKTLNRHLFLYEKVLLFCKPVAKTVHNKTTYEYKSYLRMSEIGLTESVKNDTKKFEIWLKGRLVVYTITAATVEQKQAWVNEIKGVLFNQLEELKDEKTRQYSQTHTPLRQTTSWEKQKSIGSNPSIIDNNQRAMSCDSESHHTLEDEEIEENNWSSDCTNSDDDDHTNTAIPLPRMVKGQSKVQRVVQLIIGAQGHNNTSTFYVNNF
ncbi:guanine nucleotide exchange factor DBS-like isoform X2 [Aethina tumida]|uniref:guanine nucleotide exchange factor DBS-like isoform X2 n=1 Tax=Aethina tumida TaxID=116153 RepID=UPI0021491D42|nr:guanine nucleotide exchange factor DBS-like isoform X2 [Aethina tumida]